MKIPYVMKRCSKCEEWKVANTFNFYKRKASKDGLYNYCKKCDSERSKQYKKQHKEERQQYQQQYDKQYYQTPQAQVRHFNSQAKRRQREEEQGAGITKEQWIECNEWFEWKCAYSGEKLQKNKTTHGRTLDHIIALDNGGQHEIWNLAPMRKGYNSSKNNNNNWLEWYKQQPYFSEERLQRIYDWIEYAYNKWSNKQKGAIS